MVDAKTARVELLRRRAQVDLLAFLQYCWWMPGPLHVGRHTRALCARLTRAVDDFLEGRDTYLLVNMPFRHGKSDLVSRALPAFFLGRCREAQPNIIMSGYGSSLVRGFSANVQTILESEAYQRVFPGMRIDPDKNATDEWKIRDSVSSVYAQGLGGSITGKGGNLIIVDDYCKNSEEADSPSLREKAWQSFRTDLCTRVNAPAHIVIVCATRWHADDVAGRIVAEMGRNPHYPRYEQLVFPARKEGPGGWETLFPEHYKPSWYAEQRAQLGSRQAAALLDCNPVGDDTRLLLDSWWHEYGEAPRREEMNVVVEVDPANSKKVNADYTTMWVKGFAADGNVYVLDIVHDRMNLRERTDMVFELHRRWRPNAVAYESYGLDGDIQHIEMEQDRVRYHFPLIRLKHTVRKESRIQRVQPWFEQGRYWFPNRLLRKRADGSVYDAVAEFREQEFECYPAGAHDDMLDAFSDDFDEELRDVCRFPETAEAKALRAASGGASASYGGVDRVFSDEW